MKRSKTSRKVTFMNVTTIIDPLTCRNELQKRAEKGLITPSTYWYSLRASWNNMNQEEKNIECALLS